MVIGRSASTKEKPLINISIIEFPEQYFTRLNNIFKNIADACALCDVWAIFFQPEGHNFCGRLYIRRRVQIAAAARIVQTKPSIL